MKISSIIKIVKSSSSEKFEFHPNQKIMKSSLTSQNYEAVIHYKICEIIMWRFWSCYPHQIIVKPSFTPPDYEAIIINWRFWGHYYPTARRNHHTPQNHEAIIFTAGVFKVITLMNQSFIPKTCEAFLNWNYWRYHSLQDWSHNPTLYKLEAVIHNGEN